MFRHRLLAVVSVALAMPILSGCAQAPETRPVLPLPILDEMEPSVASELELRRSELDSLLEGAVPATERGQAIGQMGRLYHAHRLFDVAEAFYREAQSLEPERFEWAYYLGVLLSRRGELDEASASFGRALELRPRDVPALIRLADIERDRGNLDDSEARYSEARALDASQAAAPYGLGRVAAARGDDDEAVVQFDQALELQPSALVIHYQLGQAYRRLGQRERAESHLARSGRVQITMTDPLIRELSTLTRGAAPHIAQGNTALRQGRPARAAAAYRRAVEADPENAQARQSLGTILIRLGDVEGAVEQFTAVAELAPDDARAHADLGIALAAQDNFDEALTRLRRAVELEPERTEALFALGNTLSSLGRYEDAVSTYRRILEIDATDLPARSRLGTTLSQTGNHEESITELRHVVSQIPEDAQARINLGVALGRAGDDDGALRELQDVLKLDAGDASDESLALAHFNLASFYERTSEPSQALHHYRRALDLDPDDAEARFELAELLTRSRQLEEALPHYVRAGELGGGHPTARVREAEILMRLARFPEAKAVLGETVAATPRDANAAHALARLLAGAPDASLRDGPRALSLAEQLFDSFQTPPHTETLAMALAEVGEHEEAARAQRAVLEEAKRLNRTQDADRLTKNLARYESGTACCADPADVYPPVLPGSPFTGVR